MDVSTEEFSLNHSVSLALAALKQVQGKLADEEYRLSLERSAIKKAMVAAQRETYKDLLSAFADLLEAVDARWQLVAEALGFAAQKFPAGQAAIPQAILHGNNAQVAQKIRRELARELDSRL